MWWREGVLYQVYPRSFADSNGDGIGDLPGVISRLDYLEWLGVDGLWLSPIHPSPNEDWGYDVSDYLGVHPDLGTLEDVDRLVAEAEKRGIRVLLDLVPNHTSDRHPWFSDPAKRDWYVWADRPNNWVSTFGGSAWTRDERSGRYYLHNFLPEQPDLNWWNEGVRDAFDEILRFWFDRGIAGFRIDVAHALVKDRLLRDNPVVGANPDPREERRYNMNQPEVHDVYRRWRAIARGYEPERLLLGETWVSDLGELGRYYGRGDELQLAMNFPFVLADFDAAELREIVEGSERAYPDDAWPVWCGSNHDVVRFTTRWCGGDERKIRCALLVLLTLRGTPILYYGDELGLEQAEVPVEAALDPVAVRLSPERGRDGARTPMPWTATGGEWRDPWLPLGDTTRNVEDLRDDPASTLSFCRDVLSLRRSEPMLRTGGYAPLDAPPGVWAWRRGDSAVVAVNLSDRQTALRGVDGTVRIDTERAREGERASGRLQLRPWQGAVLTG